MTYTEFIKGVENNIAKANCNKLNIGEYEEKQKQIYKQIRADAIDEFVEKICEKYTEEERKGNYKQYCGGIKQNIADIAEQLKVKEQNE